MRLSAFRGLKCTLGIDLSDKGDVTAMVLAAKDGADCLLVKSWFFLPEAALDRTSQADRENVTLYRKWKAGRHLIVTDGDMVEQRVVKRKALRLIRALGIRHVTFDQWGSQIIASEINEEATNPNDPVAFIMAKTAANVTPAAKDIETRVHAKGALIRHDDNPVMNWMIGNAVVEHRVNGSLLPKKPKGGSRQKIDGVDALVNAVAPLILPSEAPVESVFEQRARARAEMQHG